MRSMAETASRTTLPERSAFDRASRTVSRASPARLEVAETLAVISSSAAAVSSREAACCSVRRERSSDADDTSCAPPFTVCTDWPTLVSASRS
ncbi:hypothetical protein D3C71_1568540 [compost metagenome]